MKNINYLIFKYLSVVLCLMVFNLANTFSQSLYTNYAEVFFSKKDFKKIKDENLHFQDSVIYKLAEKKEYNTTENKSMFYYCLALFYEMEKKTELAKNYYFLVNFYIEDSKYIEKETIRKEMRTKIDTAIDYKTFEMLEKIYQKEYSLNLPNQVEIYLMTKKVFEAEAYQFIDNKIDATKFNLTKKFLLYRLFQNNNQIDSAKLRLEIQNLVIKSKNNDEILFDYYKKEEVLKIVGYQEKIIKKDEPKKTVTTDEPKKDFILVSENDIANQIIKLNAYVPLIKLALENKFYLLENDTIKVTELNVTSENSYSQDMNIYLKFKVNKNTEIYNLTHAEFMIQTIIYEMSGYLLAGKDVSINADYSIDFYNCPNLKIIYPGEVSKIILDANYYLTEFYNTTKKTRGNIIPLIIKDKEMIAEDYAFLILNNLNSELEKHFKNHTSKIESKYTVNLFDNNDKKTYYEVTINFYFKDIFKKDAEALKNLINNYKLKP